ncbi:hypothetical protein F4818DRAFT_24741 [Hypoxylon cercidicola]|nr:hypothetical protein F4818DRAFT_24741 [Hypoxylon cercidicola]
MVASGSARYGCHLFIFKFLLCQARRTAEQAPGEGRRFDLMKLSRKATTLWGWHVAFQISYIPTLSSSPCTWTNSIELVSFTNTRRPQGHEIPTQIVHLVSFHTTYTIP